MALKLLIFLKINSLQCVKKGPSHDLGACVSRPQDGTPTGLTAYKLWVSGYACILRQIMQQRHALKESRTTCWQHTEKFSVTP